MNAKVKDFNQLSNYKLFINGEWVEASTGKTIEVNSPSTGETLGFVADAGKDDVEQALASAEKAQPAWQALSPFQRGAYIVKLMDLLAEKKEHFAHILVQEQGKTYKDALVEVDDTIGYMKFAVDSAAHIKGDILPHPDGKRRMLVEKVPFGVVLALCAWNYPLALVGRKLGPALVTGNTIIIKPHELTPLATAEFMKLVEQAGLPAGVVNLITGTGPETGSMLVQDSRTKMISLTGSVKAGQAVYKGASKNISGLTLELGGKAPFIILKDADLDKAVDAAMESRYSNCGQVCICSDMVFVQESIADEFTRRLLERVKDIKVGDPFDDSTDMGPKASLMDLEKIDQIVKETVAQGATAAAGGERLKGGIYDKGYFYPPTVLTDVQPEMTAAQEEIFGPVLPIIRIKDFDEAVKITNSSPFGLAAYLFTRNHSTIMEAGRKLEVGTLFINQGIDGQFHGFHSGHKLSGTGGEDGIYGLEAYMQKRILYMDVSA